MLRLLVISIVLIPTADALAAEPAIETLLKRVPALTTNTTGIKNFSAKITVLHADNAFIEAQICWDKDKGESLLLVEQPSNIPVFIIAEGKAVVFDFARKRLLIFTDVAPAIQIHARSKDKVVFGYGISSGKTKFDIDPASLFIGTKPRAASKKTNSGQWRQRRVTASGRSDIMGDFDPTQEYPLKSVNMTPALADLSTVSIEDIQVNSELFAPRSFPKLSGLPGDLKKQHQSIDRLDSMALVMGVLIRNRALMDPSFRENIDQKLEPFLRDVDWVESERYCRDAVPLLRKALGLSLQRSKLGAEDSGR